MFLPETELCRLSAEPLKGAEVLFELQACPLPGIYPETAEDSVGLVSPLKVVQARGSGLVQLGHSFDATLYSQYAFAGGGAGAYRQHLAWFADKIAQCFQPDSSILEVGCGDGSLLRILQRNGFQGIWGIDPSRAASQEADKCVTTGFFPEDLPQSERQLQRDLVVCRHVLEHIETPLTFMRSLAAALKPNGELWIEVPDLVSAVERGLWSNFYQLHCNYFTAGTLDQLAATAGLRCIEGAVVNVFGGSLLRRYVLGEPEQVAASEILTDVSGRVEAYRLRLRQLALELPLGAVGYGAAERTAAILGFAHEFADRLTCLYDGNPLLADRFLAGTKLPIRPKERMFAAPPPAIVLFAISNAEEILREWKLRLPPETLVCVLEGNFIFRPLFDYP